jgi:protein-tyrosine phosphatase
MSVVEIIPHLYLGNIKSSLDLTFIREAKINCIINCTKNFNFIENLPENIKKIRISLSDTGTDEANECMLTILDKAVTLIYRELIKGNVILIHCYAGKQRSLAIVVAFLIKYSFLSKDEVLKFLFKRWPYYPDHYEKALNAYCASL